MAVLLLYPATALAGKPFFAYGEGIQTSCGQFIAATQGQNLNTFTWAQRDGVTFWSENKRMMEYVYGVLTGINLNRDQSHQIQNDPPAIELWLRNWCTRRPKSNLLDAVTAFAAETPGTPIK